MSPAVLPVRRGAKRNPRPRFPDASQIEPLHSPSETKRRLLVRPPVALSVDVSARIVTEVGRADDEDLEALRTRLVTTPRAGRDAHRVPLLELDDLVVDLHPPAPTH